MDATGSKGPLYPPLQGINNSRANLVQEAPKYVGLRNMLSHEGPWVPGPTGFDPKDLDPPRLEYKELHENVLILDYKDQKVTAEIASKLTRTYAHRFWGEVFTGLMVITDFFFALALEAYGYVAKVVIHLVLGILVRTSDYIIKPMLVFFFNTMILPYFTHVNALLGAVLRCLQPLLDLIQRLVDIASIPIRALRIVEVKTVQKKYYGSQTYDV